MGSVRVAIVGVGNCATSLIQGVEYYRDADPDGSVPGLMHVKFGEYHVGDVEFVAAFDVDAKKVGFDLSEATHASENNTIKIADVPPLGVTVQRGPTMDGLGKYYRETIEESDAEPVDVVAVLKETKADVLVAYLPVGSEQADKFYAQCAIDAGVAFVNALPVFIASDPVWAKKFEDAGIPIVGDDIKSQVGATITHRVMAKLFEDRGVVLDQALLLLLLGSVGRAASGASCRVAARVASRRRCRRSARESPTRRSAAAASCPAPGAPRTGAGRRHGFPARAWPSARTARPAAPRRRPAAASAPGRLPRRAAPRQRAAHRPAREFALERRRQRARPIGRQAVVAGQHLNDDRRGALCPQQALEIGLVQRQLDVRREPPRAPVAAHAASSPRGSSTTSAAVSA